MGGRVEHAGRVIQVKLERSVVDIHDPMSRTKVMVMIRAATHQGEFIVALPPNKAKELAILIGSVVDESFVRKIMNE